MTDDGPAGLADNSESASVPSQTRNSTSDRVVTCHMRGTTSTYMHGHIQGMASMHYLLYGALLSVMLGTYCTYRTVQYSTVQYWIRYPVRHRAAESGGRVVVCVCVCVTMSDRVPQHLLKFFFSMREPDPRVSPAGGRLI